MKCKAIGMKRTQTLLLAALIAGACLFGGCNLGDGSNCDCPKFGQTNQQLDNQLALATHSLE
jgi:hypothetical protein